METYLAQHDVQPVTIEKLRYLLSQGDGGVRRPDDRRADLAGVDLSPGYRFEATQALRQVLHRAVA